MKMPSREKIAEMRRIYTKGSRVELDSMDDPQAPPQGTRGTVLGVDDIGSIMVAWDNAQDLVRYRFEQLGTNFQLFHRGKSRTVCVTYA